MMIGYETVESFIAKIKHNKFFKLGLLLSGILVEGGLIVTAYISPVPIIILALVLWFQSMFGSAIMLLGLLGGQNKIERWMWSGGLLGMASIFVFMTYVISIPSFLFLPAITTTVTAMSTAMLIGMIVGVKRAYLSGHFDEPILETQPQTLTFLQPIAPTHDLVHANHFFEPVTDLPDTLMQRPLTLQ